MGKSALRIARFLRDAYDLDMIAPTPSLAPGHVASSIEHGFRVHRVGKLSNDGLTLELVRRVIERLDQQSPFCIFHGFFLSSAKPCLDVSHGRPVIASIRGNDAVAMRREPLWIDTIDRIVDEATWVTSVANDLLVSFARGRTRRDACSLIFNSINLTRHKVRWSSSANYGTIGTLANLRKKKNLPLLLMGYANIRRSLRTKLLVAGGFEAAPDLRAQLQSLAAELSIETELNLFGPVPPRDVPAMLGKMYIFALTSDHEGMPNAMLEAAAAGVPIVATAVGAIPDIMTPERDGLVIQPGDPDALAAALSRVLASPEFAARLSVGARELAERFDYSSERSQWLDLYQNLLISPVALYA